MTQTTRLAHPIADLARRLDIRRGHARHRRAMRHVASLDDHLLRDIGLTRSQATRAARLPLSADVAADLQTRAFRRHRRTG